MAFQRTKIGSLVKIYYREKRSEAFRRDESVISFRYRQDKCLMLYPLSTRKNEAPLTGNRGHTIATRLFLYMVRNILKWLHRYEDTKSEN